MKKNGVKYVVKNYKNGVKIEVGHNDIDVETVAFQRQEIGRILVLVTEEKYFMNGYWERTN